MVKDMTEGSPYKLILSFCIPLMFGNLFQQMYNMVGYNYRWTFSR